MKKKVIFALIITFCLIVVIIGINFNRNMKIDDIDWNIYFANLKTSIVNGNVFIPEDPVLEATSIKAYDVLVNKSGDYVTYTFDVINDGNVDATLESFIKTEPKCISLLLPANRQDEKKVCDNLIYSITYTDTNKKVLVSDVIKAKTKKNLTLKIEYINNIKEQLAGDVQITFYDMTFVYN